MAKHLTWDELVPYERQQGGYWEYGTCTDVYGNGKTWVPVRNPAMANEPIVTSVVRYECPYCTQHYPERQKAVDHIARCWSNPENKTCRTCVFFIPAASEADMCGVYGCTCGNFPESCDLDIELPENAPVVGCQKWQARQEDFASGVRS